MKIPILFKMIVVVVSFLGIMISIFAQESAELFENVLTHREEYSNMNQASAKATEVQTLLASELEKTQLIGGLLLKQSLDKRADETDLQIGFTHDMALISLDVVKITDDKAELIGRRVKSGVLAKAGLTDDFIPQLRELQKFPVAQISTRKIILRNSSYPKGYPVVTLGLPLVNDEKTKSRYVALADIDLAYLQKSFAIDSDRILFLVNDLGELLAHQDERKALARHSLRGNPLLDKALADSLNARQIQFQDPETNEAMIGAYVRLPMYGLWVVSETPRSIIMEPALEVRRKAIWIAGTVISVALFILFLFSSSITGPIEVLAELVVNITHGDFDGRARDRMKVFFPDEVSELALAFDRMSIGLRERDKFKTLLAKFHGSKVAEDLIKSTIGRAGRKKEVTVFFSDIRGFTAFSETRAPEKWWKCSTSTSK